MKTIQTKSGDILLVEIPEDAYDFEFLTSKRHLRYKTKQFNHITGAQNSIDVPLYVNSVSNLAFEILGKFSELGDKVFEEFVSTLPNEICTQEFNEYPIYEDFSNIFEDYLETNKWVYDSSGVCYYGYKTAKESFKSLCKSQGIEDDLDNYLIIKKYVS
jgi:hypothetical protein